MKQESAYKESGVNIDEAAELVERIKPAIAKTKRPGVMSGLGGFGAMFDLKPMNYEDPILVSSTDGVGTKLKIAIDTNNHSGVGIDLVAMCVNDLVVQGAEPLFFLDYFATGKLENDHAQAVIEGIAKGCEIAGCALIGGETAEMPGMYSGGDYDLAGFTVGAVERARIITGETITEGDVILGLASDGVHSNGFSLVRRIVDTTQGYDYGSSVSFSSRTFGEELLTPTRIYVKPVLEALKINTANDTPAIKGMAHITGGGLVENIPRVLPENVCAEIDASAWPLPPLFAWLKDAGKLDAFDMARTLNCGIGFVVICESNDKDAITQSLQNSGETAYEIGRVTARTDEPIKILNMDSSWPEN